MTSSINKESEDLLVITLDGILTFDELKEIEKKATASFVPGYTVKMLMLAEKFTGWAEEGDWSNTDFMRAHDQDMEKIAVVCKEDWKERLFNYLCVDLRRTPVEFFQPDKEEEARAWLQKKADS